MSVKRQILYARVENLLLDPKNPRLGRYNIERNLSQVELLDIMQDWELDELAVSYLESGGFWVQEAVIVVRENGAADQWTVVEGNRRVAALKLLKLAFEGNQEIPRKWQSFAKNYVLPPKLFESVPFLEAETREDVQTFLGFRHVTGIKEWAPAEKAEFISKLVDQGMTYEQITKRIGSRVPAVRQNNIAYRLLRQLEEQVEDFDPQLQAVHNRFSVMYLSLRFPSVQQYLQIDIEELPAQTDSPVAKPNLRQLENYSRWIFGTKKTSPLFTDSRQMGEFAKVLENPAALEYLETSAEPRFDVAIQRAGGDLTELGKNLREASTLLQVSLTVAHLYGDNDEIQKAVNIIAKHMRQLANTFPQIKAEICKE